MLFGSREQPLQEPRSAMQYRAESIDVNGIDANAGCALVFGARHSTVTVLAKLRGRSTSKPFACAMA